MTDHSSVLLDSHTVSLADGFIGRAGGRGARGAGREAYELFD